MKFKYAIATLLIFFSSFFLQAEDVWSGVDIIKDYAKEKERIIQQEKNDLHDILTSLARKYKNKGESQKADLVAHKLDALNNNGALPSSSLSSLSSSSSIRPTAKGAFLLNPDNGTRKGRLRMAKTPNNSLTKSLIAVWSREGDEVNWFINVEQPGTYHADIYFRYNSDIPVDMVFQLGNSIHFLNMVANKHTAFMPSSTKTPVTSASSFKNIPMEQGIQQISLRLTKNKDKGAGTLQVFGVRIYPATMDVEENIYPDLWEPPNPNILSMEMEILCQLVSKRKEQHLAQLKSKAGNRLKQLAEFYKSLNFDNHANFIVNVSFNIDSYSPTSPALTRLPSPDSLKSPNTPTTPTGQPVAIDGDFLVGKWQCVSFDIAYEFRKPDRVVYYQDGKRDSKWRDKKFEFDVSSKRFHFTNSSGNRTVYVTVQDPNSILIRGLVYRRESK